jgi:hypothetical protein
MRYHTRKIKISRKKTNMSLPPPPQKAIKCASQSQYTLYI